METIYKTMAQDIRDEMVCCDIYRKMMEAFHEKGIFAYREMKRSPDYHAICYYGEMAAQYVEERGDEDRREAYQPLGEGYPPSCETDPKIHTGHYEPR